MTVVRPITAGELPTFFSLEPDPARAADQAAYFERMVQAGAMRPDHCYIATDGDHHVGRFALWSLPSGETPIAFVLLDVAASVDAADGRAAIAAALLDTAVSEGTAGSPPEFGYVLDEPAQTPQWQGDPAERATWLNAAGFSVVRSTSRWSFDGPPPDVGDRLTYRAIEDVGEAAFLAALELVSIGTLDARIVSDRERLGPAGEAREMLGDVRSLDIRPGWLELAFEASGDLVGLVMPAQAPAMATIGYIGVVPAQRGRGYINDLLAHCTATLRRDVPDLPIRADTDQANAPMAAAFERAGYARFADRREFELPLGPSRPSDASATQAAT
jgi:hypothetical protein